MDQRPVAIVGYDGAELLDIACVTTSFGMANATGGVRKPYQVMVVSPGGQPISCGPGVLLHSGEALERLTGPLDTLIISGGLGHADAATNPLVVAHVQRLAKISRRVASVCTGASVLAAAGLLDGRRATTHWRFADALAARYPRVEVDPDPIYIRDGMISTAAGVTSALDLALAFIEEDHGVDVARMLARELVTYLQRPGNQAQMSMFTAGPSPANPAVRRVVEHVTANLRGDLSTMALAGVAGVGARHLTRLFLTDVGQTPGRHVRHLRTEAAARLLVTTSLPLGSIAEQCGFGSTETLRLTFLGRYGIPPSRYRSIHRGTDTTVATVPTGSLEPGTGTATPTA
ncbi:GlxA family transcriptional regulator [Plantactinospora siamensis]|uniref:GlxA family transcriptional regulator n=1 Tax=Plantactinospora siamensis TaxID=555372 RepID=A0ABV6NW08_9ACTN